MVFLSDNFMLILRLTRTDPPTSGAFTVNTPPSNRFRDLKGGVFVEKNFLGFEGGGVFVENFFFKISPN